MSTGFRSRAEDAIDSGVGLRIASAMDTLAAKREAAEADLKNYQELRVSASRIRARVIERLPDLLEQLADGVEAAGGKVFFAGDAQEANDYIVDVARDHDAHRIVKSKSMVTEELKLNHELEAAGMKVVETDLGEWIVQLAEEPPAHIVAPAVHMNRRDIADLFAKHGRDALNDIPEELTQFAREQLRKEFLAADLGISGVNFGVAETGSIGIITNEGNGRMVTSVPPVHIAVMGMERIVETWGEFELLMAMLPRAATGAPLTVYVNMITGPRRPGEVDGPDEFHLVILDNGRSDLIGTELQVALHCIRCGACLNVCPVFRQIGGQAYGTTYSGPIGSVISPIMVGGETKELAKASTLCGACYDACPVKIPLQDLLLALRRRDAAGASAAERTLWKGWAAAWRRPLLYRITAALARFGSRILPSRLIPRWGRGRNAPRSDGLGPPKRRS